MARCKHCGGDAWPNRWVCPPCLKKWTGRRKVTFAQAIEEIDPLTGETLKAIQKRVKELEVVNEEDNNG